MPRATGLAPDGTHVLFAEEDGTGTYTIDDAMANMTETYCYRCNNRMWPGQTGGHYCADHQMWRCFGCGVCDSGRYSDHDEYFVHPFSYRPHFKPKGNWRVTDGFYREPLMGVELEVGGRSARYISPVVRQVDDSEDHLYMKEDGSISGVEIVTHPMTLEYARDYPFPELLKSLRKARCKVDDGYGLHIHVARNAFHVKGKQSSTHQMVWLLFLYRNSGKLEMLARRHANRYATWHKPRPGELVRKAKFVGDRYNDSRYVAVNCNNNATFELRFFKATLSEQEFYAALEFADASVRYTREIHTRDVLRGGALTWPHFVEWVERHNYVQLAAELDVREEVAAEAARIQRERMELRRNRRREEETEIGNPFRRTLLMSQVYHTWEDAMRAATIFSLRAEVGELFINEGPDGTFYLASES